MNTIKKHRRIVIIKIATIICIAISIITEPFLYTEAINCYSCTFSRIPLKLSQNGCETNPIGKRYLRTFQSKYRPGQEKDKLKLKEPFCNILTARISTGTNTTEQDILEIYRFGGTVRFKGEKDTDQDLDQEQDYNEDRLDVNNCMNVTQTITNISNQNIKQIYRSYGFNLSTVQFQLCYCNDRDGCNDGHGQ